MTFMTWIKPLKGVTVAVAESAPSENFDVVSRVGGGIVAQGQCGTDIAFMTFHEQTLWI